MISKIEQVARSRRDHRPARPTSPCRRAWQSVRAEPRRLARSVGAAHAGTLQAAPTSTASRLAPTSSRNQHFAATGSHRNEPVLRREHDAEHQAARACRRHKSVFASSRRNRPRPGRTSPAVAASDMHQIKRHPHDVRTEHDSDRERAGDPAKSKKKNDGQ